MKQIIENKLYNTETAKKLCSFRRKVNEGGIPFLPGYCYAPYHCFEVYVTVNGSDFQYDTKDHTISVLSETDVKSIMSRFYPDEYTMVFGSIEEA